ncbi:MAG: hypothetical protein PHS92_02565 [Candidatus Gracilibacteria bacterium]|nr:hypothetical protein [Candidatus Gracilibacteria bacterium]
MPKDHVQDPELKIRSDSSSILSEPTNNLRGIVADNISETISNEKLDEADALKKIEALESELKEALEIYDDIYPGQIFGNISSTKDEIEEGYHNEDYLTKSLIDIYAMFGMREITQENIPAYSNVISIIRSRSDNPELQAHMLKCIDLFERYIISMNDKKAKDFESNHFKKALFDMLNSAIFAKYNINANNESLAWVKDFRNISKNSLSKECIRIINSYIEMLNENTEYMSEITRYLSNEKLNIGETGKIELKDIDFVASSLMREIN